MGGATAEGGVREVGGRDRGCWGEGRCVNVRTRCLLACYACEARSALEYKSMPSCLLCLVGTYV